MIVMATVIEIEKEEVGIGIESGIEHQMLKTGRCHGRVIQ